jgi:hypothetical protein
MQEMCKKARQHIGNFIKLDKEFTNPHISFENKLHKLLISLPCPVMFKNVEGRNDFNTHSIFIFL